MIGLKLIDFWINKTKKYALNTDYDRIESKIYSNSFFYEYLVKHGLW